MLSKRRYQLFDHIGHVISLKVDDHSTHVQMVNDDIFIIWKYFLFAVFCLIKMLYNFFFESTLIGVAECNSSSLLRLPDFPPQIIIKV